jgi:hypothetical protein
MRDQKFKGMIDCGEDWLKQAPGVAVFFDIFGGNGL